MTDQCHAGTALLIREYQVEYRRASLTPVAFSTASDLPVARPDPLDRSFHIRSDRKVPQGVPAALVLLDGQFFLGQ